MGLSLKAASRYAILAVSGLLTLFVLSQVAQLIALANSVHPAFGAAVALLLLAGLVALILVPTSPTCGWSRPSRPPSEPDGPAHDAFVRRNLASCRRNPRLADTPLETEADL